MIQAVLQKKSSEALATPKICDKNCAWRAFWKILDR